ncbi:hypothetical protein H4R20_001543 [Coemansia guatemalensis]|uniref:Major facilitator superfamily (MFS) profile domain-containing protein n=1 Tax=Coemansia guatemalensis TaxID=2761395 RepID=A0A9W8I5M8_9FUNG|nr:hypothetical protein H4R20_001543 [Coemansia guatemalensis]
MKRSISNPDRRSASTANSAKSAVELYREWLDTVSSGSEDENDDEPSTSSRDLTRPISPQDPVNRPQMISPRKQLRPLPSAHDQTQDYPAPPSKAHRRQMSPSRILRGPRKLMTQMSFRSMLSSPSPHPQPAPPSESSNNNSQSENNNRRSRRQSSMGTLFSDAWITRPGKVHKSAKVIAPTDSRQTLYDIPLDSERPQPFANSADSSDTIEEKPMWRDDEKPRRRRGSVDWDFHRVDSPHGWWVVAWAFLACSVSLSTLVNYPIYEAYYTATARQADPASLTDPARGQDLFAGIHPPSTYAVLIGSLMSGFAALGSLGAGVASDVLGMRICAVAGTLVLSVGLLASSFLARLWALCITQGVVSGIGIALLALPAYTAPAHWFDRHRALSTGVAAAGTGIGVLALTPAYRAILQHRGLAISLYVQTLVTLALGLISAFGLRPRVNLHAPAVMRWRRALGDLRILALMAMALFAAAARFAQLLCLPVFARTAGAENDIGGVVYAVGAALLVGMVLGGTAADKSGYIAGLGLSELILGLFTLALYTPSTSIAPLYVFSVVFGLTTGTLASVLPAAIAQMFGMQRLATTTGLVLSACAPALLATAPAAIRFNQLAIEGSSVAWLSAISGVFSIVAGFLGLMLPVLQRRYVKLFTRKETSYAWPHK